MAKTGVYAIVLDTLFASQTIMSKKMWKERRGILALICEALAGGPTRLRSNRLLLGAPGFSGGAANDGRAIYLPDTAPSFALYKLMALHQVMLLRRGEAPARAVSLDSTREHMEADRRLIERLPGLEPEMRANAGCSLPDGYPTNQNKRPPAPLPWWGDIISDLAADARGAIQSLRKKAAEQFPDLPPDMIERLLTSLMADGARDKDQPWSMFAEMLDNLELASPDAEAPRESVETFFYKEWDQHLGDYKMDWRLVRQRPAKADYHPFAADLRERRGGLIKLIRRQFQRLKPERFRKFRAQPHGDGLDIDALIDAVTDLRSGASLSENVYIRRDKRIRDVAALFLVDLSISTDEIVNDRRIIDIQKEAMVLMAEALDALNDPYAIYGFSSDGRFRVDLFSVKEFAEPYNETVQHRLGNLEPLGLTRMGAVIRHASHKLDEVTAAVKLLVILTDGRPYDLEYGGLDYAIADTKKAIQEARRRHLHPFIITVDPKSVDYLRWIAPQTQSIIAPRVEMLPTLLPGLYKRLTG